MNEDSREDSAFSKALKTVAVIGAVGAVGYGAHKGLMSQTAKNYVKNKDNGLSRGIKLHQENSKKANRFIRDQLLDIRDAYKGTNRYRYESPIGPPRTSQYDSPIGPPKASQYSSPIGPSRPPQYDSPIGPLTKEADSILNGGLKPGNPKDIVTTPGVTQRNSGTIVNSDGVAIGGDNVKVALGKDIRKANLVTNPDGTTIRDNIIQNTGRDPRRDRNNIMLPGVERNKNPKTILL